MLHEIVIGEPELVGEPVRTRLGQAAEIGAGSGGDAEIYFAANGARAEFFCLDLWTGRCKFRAEIPGECVVWGMTIGRDGNVYLSGDGTGVLYRYDPVRSRLESVGAYPGDPFVWDLKPWGDSIFGATYPKARIFEYDLARSEYRDWGRADEEAFYARGIAADERFLYVGLGSTAGIVKVDRADGRKTKLEVPGVTGRQGFVERLWVFGNHLVFSVQKEDTVVYDLTENRVVDTFRADGFVCGEAEDVESRSGSAGGNTGKDGSVRGGNRLYFTSGDGLYRWEDAGSVTRLATLPAGARNGKSRVKAMKWVDGRVLAIVTNHGECFLYDRSRGEVRSVGLEIEPKPVQVNALAFDGDRRLYVGGYQRGLALWNLKERRLEWEILHFPQTEGIGIDDRGDVYFGTYTRAVVYRYDPWEPFNPHGDAGANPEYLFRIGEHQDRPFAIASGDGYVFFGTVPDYGLLDGALTVYRPETGEYRVYPGIVPERSIISLAYRDGILYGGTSIWGGLGTEPARERAELFVWDVREGKLITRFEPDIPGIDVPPRMIGELAVGPDGLLWGLADGTVFAYDRSTMRLVKHRTIRPSEYRGSKQRPPALRFGGDGLMYTELARRLVIIDPATLDYRVIGGEGEEEEPFGLLTLGPGGDLYYARGSRLIRRKVIRPAGGEGGKG